VVLAVGHRSPNFAVLRFHSPTASTRGYHAFLLVQERWGREKDRKPFLNRPALGPRTWCMNIKSQLMMLAAHLLSILVYRELAFHQKSTKPPLYLSTQNGIVGGRCRHIGAVKVVFPHYMTSGCSLAKYVVVTTYKRALSEAVGSATSWLVLN